MHDGITVIWDTIILAIVTNVIGVFEFVFDVLFKNTDMPVPISPLLGVHHPKDMEELVKKSSFALCHAPVAVRQLVVALQHYLCHIWLHCMDSCTEPWSTTRSRKTSG